MPEEIEFGSPWYENEDEVPNIKFWAELKLESGISEEIKCCISYDTIKNHFNTPCKPKRDSLLGAFQLIEPEVMAVAEEWIISRKYKIKENVGYLELKF